MASDRSAQIMGKAQELGAAIAGIASVGLLQESPSHEIQGKFGTKIDGVHSFAGMMEGHSRWEIDGPSPAIAAHDAPSPSGATASPRWHPPAGMAAQLVSRNSLRPIDSLS
jgi:hypothetical protein